MFSSQCSLTAFRDLSYTYSQAIGICEERSNQPLVWASPEQSAKIFFDTPRPDRIGIFRSVKWLVNYILDPITDQLMIDMVQEKV